MNPRPRAEASEEFPRHLRRALREIVQTALQAVVLYLVLSTLMGRFEIRQISMEPTFHAGQRVVVSRWERLVAPWLSGASIAHAEGDQPIEPLGLQRGRVVVIEPSPARGSESLIKRVIGLPGDTLSIVGGSVWVNGARVDEPYVHGLPTSCWNACQPVTLPPGEYFVMGDNRPNSLDSRSFGLVPGKDIVGRVVLRYWPIDSLEFYP
jgi:signal peptidase I